MLTNRQLIAAMTTLGIDRRLSHVGCEWRAEGTYGPSKVPFFNRVCRLRHAVPLPDMIGRPLAVFVCASWLLSHHREAFLAALRLGGRDRGLTRFEDIVLSEIGKLATERENANERFTGKQAG